MIQPLPPGVATLTIQAIKCFEAGENFAALMLLLGGAALTLAHPPEDARAQPAPPRQLRQGADGVYR